MEILLKVTASILTLLLLITSYYGVVEGGFFSTSFWLVYILLAAGTMLSIAYLKKIRHR